MTPLFPAIAGLLLIFEWFGGKVLDSIPPNPKDTVCALYQSYQPYESRQIADLPESVLNRYFSQNLSHLISQSGTAFNKYPQKANLLQYSLLTGSKDATVRSLSISSMHAHHIIATYSDKNGVLHHVTYKMVCENKDWKVSDIVYGKEEKSLTNILTQAVR